MMRVLSLSLGNRIERRRGAGGAGGRAREGCLGPWRTCGQGGVAPFQPQAEPISDPVVTRAQKRSITETLSCGQSAGCRVQWQVAPPASPPAAAAAAGGPAGTLPSWPGCRLGHLDPLPSAAVAANQGRRWQLVQDAWVGLQVLPHRRRAVAQKRAIQEARMRFCAQPLRRQHAVAEVHTARQHIVPAAQGGCAGRRWDQRCCVQCSQCRGTIAGADATAWILGGEGHRLPAAAALKVPSRRLLHPKANSAHGMQADAQQIQAPAGPARGHAPVWYAAGTGSSSPAPPACVVNPVAPTRQYSRPDLLHPMLAVPPRPLVRRAAPRTVLFIRPPRAHHGSPAGRAAIQVQWVHAHEAGRGGWRLAGGGWVLPPASRHAVSCGAPKPSRVPTACNCMAMTADRLLGDCSVHTSPATNSRPPSPTSQPWFRGARPALTGTRAPAQ